MSCMYHVAIIISKRMLSKWMKSRNSRFVRLKSFHLFKPAYNNTDTLESHFICIIREAIEVFASSASASGGKVDQVIWIWCPLVTSREHWEIKANFLQWLSNIERYWALIEVLHDMLKNVDQIIEWIHKVIGAI